MTASHPVRGDVAVLVPAAGLGARLGPGGPKALRELGGASLLAHTLRRVGRAPSVGWVIVAAPIGSVDHVRAVLAPELPADVVLGVVEGGATRQDSVASALAVVPAYYAIVLVHDAARAFAPPDLIERVAAAVRDGHEAVIPVLPVIDTIKQVDESGYVYATPDRTSLRAVQTPQGFRRDILAAAHQAASGTATDDAALAERIGAKVFCVAGAEAALKITRPADLATAERLLQAATLGS